MNITFLIGNGFDLNCGLKSSYHDIYLEYIKQPSSSDVIAKFKKDLWDKIDNWGDFEVAMADYMKNFKTENDFLECLRDFISFTESYLLKQEKEILDLDNDKIKKKAADEMIKSFSTFNIGVTHTLDALEVANKNINVVVFNYTSTFDTLCSYCYPYYPYVDKIIHIHGKLNDDVVMGIDNIEQVQNTSYVLSRKGKRAFIKSYFNEQYDPKRLEDAENVILDSNVICAFGMSLGESDLRWRNLLLEWMSNDSNAHLFVYQYDCSSLPRLRAEERMDKEDDKKIELLNSWGIIGDEVDTYFDQIHIPCCKNIFNIEKTIAETKLRILAEETAEREVWNRIKENNDPTVLSVYNQGEYNDQL